MQVVNSSFLLSASQAAERRGKDYLDWSTYLNLEYLSE